MTGQPPFPLEAAMTKPFLTIASFGINELLGKIKRRFPSDGQ